MFPFRWISRRRRMITVRIKCKSEHETVESFHFQSSCSLLLLEWCVLCLYPPSFYLPSSFYLSNEAPRDRWWKSKFFSWTLPWRWLRSSRYTCIEFSSGRPNRNKRLTFIHLLISYKWNYTWSSLKSCSCMAVLKSNSMCVKLGHFALNSCSTVCVINSMGSSI